MTIPVAAMDTAGYDALAADGRIVGIRPVTERDRDGLLRLYGRASDQSLYLRFFAHGRGSVGREVARLIRPPGRDHAVLVATEENAIIGVASYERIKDTDEAEFAVLVDDAEHGRGIATLLIEELANRARRAHLAGLVGDVLTTNTGMLQVARDLSPHLLIGYDGSVARIRVPTEADDAALLALDARDRIAEQHSLRPLLAPASVAVVGAGRAPGGIGHEVLRNILDHGFTGTVYPVNPNANEVAGRPAYPRLTALPGPVDLAIIAVPAPAVEPVLADAGRAGVRAAVVLSAGFGETGDAGQRAQDALLRLAREHGIRLVGPNCMGLINTASRVRLAGTFALPVPEAGGLAVASQSGAVGIAMLDHAVRTGTGISTFVSLGNKADVSGNDLLSYWFDDPATRAVALYLESFGNPGRFARIARALARRKPVLAVKGGRSIGGRRAGVSHTAAAATPNVAVDALFAQAGVVRVDTLGDLLDAARVLVDQPLPAGDRLGVVGNAGGLNILAADAAEAAGLRVPDLPGGNPRDLGAWAGPADFAAALSAQAAGGLVDAVVAIFAATRTNDGPATLAALADTVDAVESPVVAVLVGVDDAPTSLGRRGVPVFGLPEQAVRAVGHAARYAAWRREPLGSRPVLPEIDAERARAIVEVALAAGGGWQPWATGAALLDCYGIPVVDTLLRRGTDAVLAAAEDLGYPVVVKAADPTVTHRTDVGLVRLDLADGVAVREAYHEICATLDDPDTPVAVQPMRAGGVELALGIVHDPLFGSLVMAGLGGVHTDLIGDRAYRLLPMTDLDAGRMWRSLHGAPLLTGYRGSAPVDTARVEDVLARLGRLAEDLPEVAELDLNPLLAFPDGAAAVDLKVRLAPVGAEPDRARRGLR